MKLGPNFSIDIPVDGDFLFAEPTGSAIAASMEDIKHLEELINKFAISFTDGEYRSKTAAQILFEASREQANFKSLVRNKRSCLEEVFKTWCLYNTFKCYGGLDGSISIRTRLLCLGAAAG